MWGLWWTNVYWSFLGKGVHHLANRETSTEVSSPLGCGLVCTSIDKIKWDITSSKALESVQKFACKVCLKQWDMDYESMLHSWNSHHYDNTSQVFETMVTTLYNIINGTLYFPTGYFVLNYFPYSSSHGILRPFARTICIHHLSHLSSLCGITYQTVLNFYLCI